MGPAPGRAAGGAWLHWHRFPGQSKRPALAVHGRVQTGYQRPPERLTSYTGTIAKLGALSDRVSD